jgi:hypothetical protein
MKLDVILQPSEYAIKHLFSHEERLAFADGSEERSSDFEREYQSRLRTESETLPGIQKIQALLQESKQELQDLEKTREELITERRRLLENGSSPNGIEKKLHATLTSLSIVSGRVVDLENTVSLRTPLLNSEALEMKSEAFYGCDQKGKARKAELIAILTEPRYQDAARELMQLEYDGLARANKFRRTSDDGAAQLVQQLLEAVIP